MDLKHGFPVLQSDLTPAYEPEQAGSSVSNSFQWDEAPNLEMITRHRSMRAQSDLDNSPIVGHYSRAVELEVSGDPYRCIPRSHPQPTPKVSPFSDEKRMDEAAENLWAEMLKQPAFSKYREKMLKIGGKDEQKWPEQMELAFVRALVEHPPIGRRKLNNIYLNDAKSLRGRNELIAIYIEKKTGIRRDRKQVSSHIQVLKPMFKDQPKILSYFKSDREISSGRHRPRRRPYLNNTRGRPAPPVIKGRQASDSQLPSPASELQGSTFPLLSSPRFPFELPLGDIFRLRQFRLFMADAQKRSRPTHVLTCSSDSSRQPDLIWDKEFWPCPQRHPRLAELLDSGRSPSQTLMCEASLRLVRQEVSSDAEVRIEFDMAVPRYATKLGGLMVRTVFYQDGIVVNGQGTERKLDVDGQEMKCHLPFGSAFWASRIMSWQRALQQTSPECHEHAADQIERSLRHLTAVQEVYCESDVAVDFPVLLICWTFRWSAHAEGKTTWRNLILTGQNATSWTHSLPMDDVPSPAQHGHSQTEPNSLAMSTGSFDIGGLLPDQIGDSEAGCSSASFNAGIWAASPFAFGYSDPSMPFESPTPTETYTDSSQVFGGYQPVASLPEWGTTGSNMFDYGLMMPHVLEESAQHLEVPIEATFSPQLFP